jgi:hypothetical protein
MNTLREAAQEYLSLRRRLGYNPPDQVREDPSGARIPINDAGTSPVRTVSRPRSPQATDEQLPRW